MNGTMTNNRLKSLFLLFILLSIFFLCICSKSSSVDSPFLRTRGQDIVNGHGEVIFLRGVGLGNWLLPEGYMWKFGKNGDRPRKIENIVRTLIGDSGAVEFWKAFRANYITESDIKRIAELGFNSVRPALNARLFLTEGDSAVFNEQNFKLLDDLIGWCRKYNIYVVLDMHGAPGGQTGANIDDSRADIPELFTSPRNQDRLERLWVKLASRYADNPTVIAYDLLNEPLPRKTGAAEKYGHLVEPLYRRLTAAIRKVDRNHMIVLEGINWANDWSIFGPPFDKNMFYQFHYYCWDRPDNLNDIGAFIKHREKLQRPVWVGETGEKHNTIYFATTQYFEQHNIGWSFWPWKKMATDNTPYSISRPTNWQQLSDYSSGKAKPDTATARAALWELLENIKLENCTYFPDVVNAILRRVPLKLQAENYGHGGYGKSYMVQDTSQRAATYRTNEPVPIVLLDDGHREFRSQQAVQLKAGEWLAYTVDNAQKRAYELKLRAQAEPGANVLLIVEIDGQGQTISLSDTTWQTYTLNKALLQAGKINLRIKSESGIVNIDWLDIR